MFSGTKCTSVVMYSIIKHMFFKNKPWKSNHMGKKSQNLFRDSEVTKGACTFVQNKAVGVKENKLYPNIAGKIGWLEHFCS